ncbi:MAG: hypothetical protein ABR518_00175 [Actinomycetota bacterium]
MTLRRDLLREVRSLDEFDLRRLTLFVGELLATRVGPGVPSATPAALALERPAPRASYRQQFVRCGKSGCTRCPHGPYWYAYWREDGRLRSRYVGKDPPSDGPGLHPSDD